VLIGLSAAVPAQNARPPRNEVLDLAGRLKLNVRFNQTITQNGSNFTFLFMRIINFVIDILRVRAENSRF
jgi:hypothetical protein